MKISKPEPPKLFELDETIFRPESPLTMGMSRVAIGKYFEDRSAIYLKGRICLDQANCDYCPDVRVMIGRIPHFWEVKAVGRSNQIMVYKDRLEKDCKFVSMGNRLEYFIWSHRVKVHDGITYKELIDKLNRGEKRLYSIPFTQLRHVLEGKPLRKLNGDGYGEGSSSGRWGYRASLSLFQNYFVETING